MYLVRKPHWGDTTVWEESLGQNYRTRLGSGGIPLERRGVSGPDEAANLDKWLEDQEAIINLATL